MILKKATNQKQKINYISNNIFLPSKGDIIKGTVVKVDKYSLFIDIPGFKTGVIWAGHLKEIGKNIKDYKVGDEITAVIHELDNEEGYAELYIKDIEKESKWANFKDLMERKEIIEEKVIGANRGGLIIEYKDIKGFLPVSQLSRENYPYIEGGDKEKILEELKKFIGQKIKVRIISVDEAAQKLFFSEREVENEELKKIVEKYKVGDIVEGIVSNVVDFGVFIQILDANDVPVGIEGLIHKSELDWQLVEDPREIVKVGDKIKAEIISIEDGKISLSWKKLKSNPWEEVAKKYKKGDIVKGIPFKYNPFGVFVRIENLVQGLCHISEFGSEKKMKEAIKLNEEREFMINLFDPENYKIGLKLTIK